MSKRLREIPVSRMNWFWEFIHLVEEVLFSSAAGWAVRWFASHPTLYQREASMVQGFGLGGN